MVEENIYEPWEGDRTLLLSQRERAIAEMSASGMPLKQIGVRISPPANSSEVRRELSSICLKLKCEIEELSRFFEAG